MKVDTLTMDTFICEYCQKECKSKNSLIGHKVRCKQNPNAKIWCTRKGKGTGHPAWNKGLTAETDERIKQSKETYFERFANGNYKNYSHPHTNETKELLSRKRSEYLSNAVNAGGFKDVGWYKIKNIKNKEYTVRGLWEYNVALKLNQQNILWERNRYINYISNNIKKTYNPDFYLPITDEYIEVKGFFSEKDKIKMNLVVEQNNNIKIRFMKFEDYKKYINDSIDIFNVPFYKNEKILEKWFTFNK